MSLLGRLADRIREGAERLAEGPIEEHLVALVHGPTPEIRAQAESVLLRRGGPREALALVPLLEDATLSPEAFGRVPRVVGLLGGPDLLPAIERLAADEHPGRRYGALRVLERLLKRTAEPRDGAVDRRGAWVDRVLPAARAAYDEWGLDEPIGAAGAAVLCAAGEAADVAAAVRERLGAVDPTERCAAFVLAGRLPIPSAREILLDGLGLRTPRSERRARRKGLWLLLHPDQDEASHPDAILDLVSDLGSHEREACLEALGALAEQRDLARPHLALAQDDPEPAVRSGCLAALAWMGDRSAGPPLERFIEEHIERSGVLIDHAVVALGRLGDPRSYDLLERIARDHWGKDLGWRAAEALGLLGDPRAADFFRARIEAGEARDECLGALARLRAAGALEALLAHADPEVRGRAAFFLLRRAAPGRRGAVESARARETDAGARALMDRALGK